MRRYCFRLGDWFLASAFVAWIAAYFSLEFAGSESLPNWVLLAVVYVLLAVAVIQRLRHNPTIAS